MTFRLLVLVGAFAGCFPSLAQDQAGEKLLPKAAPPAEEMAAMIKDVRQKALDYNESLPDFICTQFTKRHSAPTTGQWEPSWRPVDELTIRLSYFGKKENYRVVLVNGKPADKPLGKMSGFKTQGEFGSMLAAVFQPKSETQFTWQRWVDWNGRPTAVWSYSIDRAHSGFASNINEVIRTVHYVWAAKGLVYVDAEAERVMRLTINSVDIPPKFPTKEVQLVLDYGYQQIAGREYLLPLRSVTTTSMGKELLRSDSTFSEYRKFSADTEIKYDTNPH